MSDFRVDPNSPAGSIFTPANERSQPGEAGTPFSSILSDAIQEVNQLEASAGEEVQKVMSGEITDIHSAMIAVQKADVSFQMMMQVRNKIVSAYQEIMKMQV